MNKETFLKELEKNLRYLSPEAKEEEIKKYRNIEDYSNFDPIKTANTIYENRGINIKISTKTIFINSIKTIIDVINEKDKKKITDLIIFFVFLIFLTIIIKIPFIFVSEILYAFFSNLLSSNTATIIWNLIFDILYIITALIILINTINKKAQELENPPKKDA